MTMQRRRWVPNIETVADQLADFRDAGIDNPDGDLDTLSTIEAWQALAREHGDEWTENDWIVLVQTLALRLAAR